LPFAIALDTIFAAIGSAGSSSPQPGVYQAPRGNLYWNDPGDWVADCEGPLFCPEHREFVCDGGPGSCSCSCVVSEPDPNADCIPARLAQRLKPSELVGRQVCGEPRQVAMQRAAGAAR
jgi:hypothetical protein